MGDRYVVKSLSPMRKVIAARMSEATRTIPHFRLTADIEVDALMRLRMELKADHPGAELSLNDLLIKACAMALMDVPEMNIQLVEGGIHQYLTADIAVVTAVEGGLMTPIVRNANRKTVWGIAAEVRALLARAAKNALRMDEVFGGSFSISNLGMYGVDRFDAIINAPQCAILAIASARPRVVVTAAGEMRVATVLPVTLSIDHRAIDGVTGATFLAALRNRVEQPEHLHCYVQHCG